MDAFFVVPALISPNINENLIPALTKTIERNIILTNYASFRLALLQKYKGPLSTVISETQEKSSQGNNRSSDKYDKFVKQVTKDVSKDMKKKDVEGEILVGKYKAGIERGVKGLDDFFRERTSKENELINWKHNTAQKDAIELPKGITFYNTIGLEPTYLSLPLEMKSGIMGLSTSERLMMVAVKCVPYRMENVKDILHLAQDMRGRSEIERWFKKKWNTVVTKIPFTVPRDIRVHGARGGKTSSLFDRGGVKYDPKMDIIYSPNSEDLANPKHLAGLMSVREKTNWSTLTVFSNYDFEKNDMKETLDSYQMLVKAGWGDTVIVNETKESAYFCTTKMSACYMMPFSVMKSIMNLDNILDYSDVSRMTRPFSITPIRSALTDGYTPNMSKGHNILKEIESIIAPDTSEVDAAHKISGFRGMTAPISMPNDINMDNMSKAFRDLSGVDTGTYTDPNTGDEEKYFEGHKEMDA